MLKFAGLQGPVMFDVAPSSSGLGYRVFIPKIAGSNPAGVTNKFTCYSNKYNI